MNKTTARGGADLLNLPSEVLQCVYQHLGVRDRVRVAASARFFRSRG